MNSLTFGAQTRTEHNFFFLYRLPGDVSRFSSVLCEYAFMGIFLLRAVTDGWVCLFVWFIIVESTFKTQGKNVYHGYMFYIRVALNLRWFLFLQMFLFVISSFQLKKLIGNYTTHKKKKNSKTHVFPGTLHFRV